MLFTESFPGSLTHLVKCLDFNKTFTKIYCIENHQYHNQTEYRKKSNLHPAVQGRSHGLAWGGKFYPWTTGCHLFATPGKFFPTFYCCFIFVDKERALAILVELNLGLCDILESSIFSCPHIIHLLMIA